MNLPKLPSLEKSPSVRKMLLKFLKIRHVERTKEDLTSLLSTPHCEATYLADTWREKHQLKNREQWYREVEKPKNVSHWKGEVV